MSSEKSYSSHCNVNLSYPYRRSDPQPFHTHPHAPVQSTQHACTSTPHQAHSSQQGPHPDSPDMSPSIYQVASTHRHVITHHRSEPNISVPSLHPSPSPSKKHKAKSPSTSNPKITVTKATVPGRTSQSSRSSPYPTAHTPRLKLFSNQVAGTLPMLHADGLLYKPLKTSLEHTFYTHILSWLPSIAPFIPRFSHLQYIKLHLASLSHSNNNNAWSSQMLKKNGERIAHSCPFLVLEDLTLKYDKPNILDLKIGTRHFPPCCSRAKMRRKLRKSWCSTCRTLGVRLSGLQLFDANTQKYKALDKHACMRLDAQSFGARIALFFGNAALETATLDRFIERLESIRDILRVEHRFRWFSCSLLFVYEGGCKVDEAMEESKRQEMDVKLIDFTNFVILEDYKDRKKSKDGKDVRLDKVLDSMEEPDHGLLFGLESLVKLLKELRECGVVKERTGAGWEAFRRQSVWAEKALYPFGDKTEFNEHTTV